MSVYTSCKQKHANQECDEFHFHALRRSRIIRRRSRLARFRKPKGAGIAGNRSRRGGRDLAASLYGLAIAVAMHPFERIQGAIVRSLGLGFQPKMGPKSRLLLLKERLGDSGLATVVVAADVLPEIAVDSPYAA